MSTALHAAPIHPPTLATPPLISPAASNHQFTSTHSSPSREVYYANQQNATASPSSRRTRDRGGNGSANGSASGKSAGASSSSLPPNHLQHNNVTGEESNSAMSSRAALASPVPVAAAPSPDHYSSSSERRRNVPPVAPPRTSSTNHNGGAATSGNSRRAAPSNERATASPRHVDSSRQAPNGIITGPAPDEQKSSTSSRRRHAQMAQEPPQRSSSTREGRTGGVATIPIRTADHANSVDSQAKEAGHAAQQPSAPTSNAATEAASPGMNEHADQSRRGGRSRHDRGSARREKNTKFGDYVLGNVIGEGEFGKVKLGWKQDDSGQVAIKIIKKESLGNNPARLAKIHREVNILRGLSHPNIVHLHDMIHDESRIGIVLEYASGGELFDYILTHRYLKDTPARRLFAQLISGVGYLHKKGIVHRDLKLENLLLDRNRNIIITDFGFANMFDAKDELSEEEEFNLHDREFVKRFGMDKVKANGTRRGDLMQTSCGSPCYAAPELVVSDSLYTGRKVDVWSCGVILYAMLAGYLPFDDDPANPDGDNINLLYKYIVNTPLTFPEYVTPHARDLLRRILVPNPRRRADLFEVARHSWLSEFANIVGIITSSTTTPNDIQNTTVPAEGFPDGASGVARSASVREGSKSKATSPPAVGGLGSRHGHIDDEEATAAVKAQKDAKRRTVQVEYVAPTTQTQRGEYIVTSGDTQTRARAGSHGLVEVGGNSPNDKPLPKDPSGQKDSKSSRARPPSSHRTNANAPTGRPSRETRATSDGVYMAGAVSGAPRPQTGGSMQSTSGVGNVPRAGYGQPAPPAVAGTHVHGRIQQPSATESQDSQGMSRPNVPAKFAKMTGFEDQDHGPPSAPLSGPPSADFKGHKRSSTIGDIGQKIIGRSGSIFGRRKRSEAQGGEKSKKYPPISMANAKMGEDPRRQSVESRHSRRSFSLGLGKKQSGSVTGSSHSQDKQTRRFSLIPSFPSFSKAIGLGKEDRPERYSQPNLPMQEAYGPRSQQKRTPIYDSMHQLNDPDSAYEKSPDHQRYHQPPYDNRLPNAIPPYVQQHSVLATGSESSIDMQHRRQPSNAPYQGDHGGPEAQGARQQVSNRNGRGVLQKNNRRFNDYDDGTHRHDGSSNAARRVMDFFRRAGRTRAGEDR